MMILTLGLDNDVLSAANSFMSSQLRSKFFLSVHMLSSSVQHRNNKLYFPNLFKYVTP